MKRRIIVAAVIQNREEDYLLCKMAQDRGVFPGQWGFPGGGMEPGETMTQALQREIREELGIELTQINPWHFRDDVRKKQYADGTQEDVYMIYLVFKCVAQSESLILNDEFEEYAWVPAAEVGTYDLNEATVITVQQLGLLPKKSCGL